MNDSSRRRFDYVTVGHVTVDVMAADGTRRPGGGAFYSALQAARLGLRTLIVTKGEPEELEELLEPYRDELSIQVLPAEHTTTLATAGAGAERKQHVLAWAGAITEPLVFDTSILHLAAVARETPNSWQGHADFVGLTPQGLVREWGESGEISLVPLEPFALPSRFDAAVLSESELSCCEHLREGALLAVTAGSQPTLVHLPDGPIVPVSVPLVAEPRDDLGAGDVFAAAFFVALRDGRSALEAAAYGNAAAAVRISGVGPRAVGTAAAIAAVPAR
jgi:sugar/nucleoside kinase (ribokinase family)